MSLTEEPEAKKRRVIQELAGKVFQVRAVSTKPDGNLWDPHHIELTPQGQVSCSGGPAHGRWELMKDDVLMLIWHWDSQQNTKTAVFHKIDGTAGWLQVDGALVWRSVMLPVVAGLHAFHSGRVWCVTSLQLTFPVIFQRRTETGPCSGIATYIKYMRSNCVALQSRVSKERDLGSFIRRCVFPG